MAAATAHVLPEASEVRDGRLLIGGCDAEALAREHGTPAYVFAEDDLRERARAFTGALAAHHDGPGEIVFASKALPCTPVLRLFAQEGLGCDVASGGELHLALHAGFAPERIYLHGNAKSRAELAMALDAGVGTIVLDNAEEALRLSELLDGRSQRVLLRVTPGVDADTHEAILTGQAGSKFGFAPDDARALIADPPAGLEIAGLHMHLGSQLFALEPYRRAIRALGTLGEFPVYDLGGGLGVPYTAGDPQLDVETWVAGMVEAAHAELGAGRRARARARPRARRQRRRDALRRRVGQGRRRGGAARRRRRRDVRQPAPDALRRRLRGARRRPAWAPAASPSTVVGKHCESGDVLVRDAELPDPRPGDVVVTPATGAYGYALANNYNGQPRPPVVFCSGGRSRAVVRRETYEELHGRDV